ncbi:MAG TPA: PLP-dependent aspartate aminotransferase family protein [Thermoplasmata archaeon]|nr:PLP-dependent aspartate aminotransferase family protein [Thermoplasmata archaeon]
MSVDLLGPGMKWDTRLIHEGQPPDPQTGSVNTPVYLTSTYAQSAPGRSKGFVYSRTGNPTRATLERVVGSLEGGVGSLAFASGLAAASALFMAYPSGSRIVAGDDLYAGTRRLLDVARTHGVKVDLIDTSDLANVRRAFAEGPKVDLLYLETPTNPLLKVTDLRGAIGIARTRGARVAVDNTFASPVLQRPLELGADIVLHSSTKYLGGHSDLIGGALAFRSRALLERYRWYQNTQGGIPGPLDCFLVLRGIHTLGLRVRAHCANARRVATFLSRHPRVLRTLYPGLPKHPGYAVARRQMDDFGGMVSAEFDGGLPTARRIVRRLKVFTLAESLGGVESLVNHPALMTHRSVPAEVREAQGITGGLLRFSVGVEDPDDLIADLRQALA